MSWNNKEPGNKCTPESLCYGPKMLHLKKYNLFADDDVDMNMKHM